MRKIYGQFSQFQKELNEIYGVDYGSFKEDNAFSDLPADEPWVICPHCLEIIAMEDCIGDGKEYWDCPACCFVEDEEE